jgi:predicted nucleic acid-binding protein
VISSSSLDTNILIYAADNSDATKQDVCDRLLEKFIASRGRIPLQCLNEFYSLTTRRSLLTPSQAEAIVQRLLGSLVVIPSIIDDSVAAMRLQQQHNIQFFDALLLTTARRAGCTSFLSEDMQNGCNYEGITVRNPLDPALDLESQP